MPSIAQYNSRKTSGLLKSAENTLALLFSLTFMGIILTFYFYLSMARAVPETWRGPNLLKVVGSGVFVRKHCV
jgi:hypothetical protein